MIRWCLSATCICLLAFLFQVAFGCDGLSYQRWCINVKVIEAKSPKDYLNWNKAKKDCESTETHRLVSIESKEKLYKIKEYISNTTKKTIFYIGLSRAKGKPRGDKKNWIWTSGASLNYDYWQIGDPNVIDSKCAGTLLLNGMFADLGCEEVASYYGHTGTYIYEYPMPTQTTEKTDGVSYQYQTTAYSSTQTDIQTTVGLSSQIPTTTYSSTVIPDGNQEGDNPEDELSILYDQTVTIDNVEDVSERLAEVTETVSDTDQQETIIKSAHILEEIVSLNSTSSKVTTAVAGTVNNLLESTPGVIEMSEESRAASSAVVQSLEEQLSTVASAGLNYNFSSNNLEIEVIQLQNNFSKEGIVFYSSGNSTARVVPAEDYSESDLETSLTLPPEVYANDKKEEAIPGIFVFYKQSTLFPFSNKKGGENLTIVSGIISATIDRKETNTFKNPVVGEYTPIIAISESADIKCVFWDFKLENGIGDWSDEGCAYNATVDGRVVCHCNHLTNFAVLMDHQGQTNHSVKGDILTVLSLVGCCISLVALILTICSQIYKRNTTAYLREQHSARPRVILLNFAISLSFLYLLFIFGIEQTANQSVCIVISGLLHYFTISSVSWMTVQAVNIYLSLVRVFPTYFSHFRLKAYAIGWGMPLLPVVTSLILSIDSYSTEYYCFIKEGPVLYYGNLAVIGALFFSNFIIFLLVIRVLFCSCRKVAKTREKSKFSAAKEQVLTAIGLSIMLGLTWIFGFVAIGGSSATSNLKFWMQLLFCIFNSLQGLFLFLFFSVRTGDFKEFIGWCIAVIMCRSQSYHSNRYEKHGTSSDAAGQSAPMMSSKV